MGREPRGAGSGSRFAHIATNACCHDDFITSVWSQNKTVQISANSCISTSYVSPTMLSTVSCSYDKMHSDYINVMIQETQFLLP